MYRNSMDPIAAPAASKNKKRRFSSDEAPKVQDDSMTSYPSSFPFPTCFGAGFETAVEHMVAQSRPQIKEPLIGEVVKRFFVEKWPKMEHEFRQQVFNEIERMIFSNFHSPSPSLSKEHEISRKEEVPIPSRTSKFKLRFFNSISSVIFTNNEIKSEYGEPLKVAICDATNSNSIISTGPLSSARVEVSILQGEFDYSKWREEEQPWTSSDFDKSILTPRDGKRPLIVGNDRQLYLQNGVGLVNNLIVTDNSSWVKSKMFCLGVKIIDENFLVDFGRIEEAVSRPFRVRDQRGEGNQKHHPPSREDEVWRLEGIRKDGTYHTNLYSYGITSVGDFLDAYGQMGPTYLKTILGKRVTDKTWNMMINNAEECLADVSKVNDLVENQVMGGAEFNDNFGVLQNNLGHTDHELPSYLIELPDLESLVYY